MRRRFICNYKINTNNEIWYTSSDDNIVIPYSQIVFGANIVSNTYSDGKGVIKFDGDVTNIGNSAFLFCKSLTSITIPDSVMLIGGNAFKWCRSLTSVTIPANVTMIGNNAFYCCDSLTSITIPDSVTTIGEWAFYDCDSLISVTIPNSVTTIGYAAFRDCTSMTSINIPNNVTMIGEDAFACCGLTSVTIPDSVTTIGSGAFSDCDRLTKVTIPDSVTSIGDGAFYDCRSLTSVYCKATTPPALGGTDVFDINGSDRKIYVPYQSLDAYKTAEYWSKYAANIIGYDFYNDTVVRLITFTVNGNEHTAENWMTWQDLIDSEYNTYLPSNILYGEGVKWFMIKDGRPSYPRFYMNEYDYHVAIIKILPDGYSEVSLDDKIEENYEYYAD